MSGAAEGAAPVTAAAHGAGVALASAQAGQPPAWIMIFPSGPEIKGRDGRAFRLANPEAVVAAYKADGIDPVVDLDHRSEAARPHQLQDAGPVCGWVRDMEVREGAVWAQVDWTEHGAYLVNGRARRYVSPAFMESAGGDVLKVTSIALVIDPNFRMPALNARDADAPPPAAPDAPAAKPDTAAAPAATTAGAKPPPAAIPTAGPEAVMATATREATLAALGLGPEASPEEVTRAIAALRGEAGRADAAVATLAAERRQAAEQAVRGRVDAVIMAGKMTPAMRQWGIALATRSPELFDEYARHAEIIIKPSGLAGRRLPEAADGADDEVRRNLGLQDKARDGDGADGGDA